MGIENRRALGSPSRDEKLGREGPADPRWPRCDVAECAKPVSQRAMALEGPRLCEHHEGLLHLGFPGAANPVLGECTLACGKPAMVRYAELPGEPALCGACADSRLRHCPISKCCSSPTSSKDGGKLCSLGVACDLDPSTAAAVRWSQAIQQTNAEERERRVVARLDCPDDPGSVELCRELPPAISARLMELLAADLAKFSPAAANLAAAAARQMAIIAEQAPNVPSDLTKDHLARLGRDCARALDAMRLVVDDTSVAGPDHRYERGDMVICHLQNASRLLVAPASPAPRPPSREDRAAWRALSAGEVVLAHAQRKRGERSPGAELCRRCFDWPATGANGWMASRVARDVVARSERKAIEMARASVPALTSDVYSDQALLTLLRTLGRPSRPDASATRRYEAAGLQPPKWLSQSELISECSPLLRKLGLWPDVRGRASDAAVDSKAVEQLRKMLPNARRAREEAFGLRQRAARPKAPKRSLPMPRQRRGAQSSAKPKKAAPSRKAVAR